MSSVFYQSIHMLIGIVLITLALFQLNPSMLNGKSPQQIQMMMSVVFFVAGTFLVLFYLSHWFGEHESKHGMWWFFHIVMGLYLIYYGYVLYLMNTGESIPYPVFTFLTYGIVFVGVMSLLYSFMIPSTAAVKIPMKRTPYGPKVQVAGRRCPAEVGEEVEVVVEEKGKQVEVELDDQGTEEVGDMVEVQVGSEVGQPKQVGVDVDKVVSGHVVEPKKVQGEVVQDAVTGKKKVVGIVTEEAKVQGKVEPKVQEVPDNGKVMSKVVASGVDEKTGENVIIVEGLDGTTTVKTVPAATSGDCTCFI